jgi:uncharacterized protein (DUF2267 family)
MAITKKLVKTAGVAAGVIGMVAASTPDNAVGRAARQLAGRLGRDIRYAAASAPGLLYRLAGRAPDPNVPDDVLADRIRSSLGPLEHRLDVPRVHVMVEDHRAIVHGDVPDEATARAIEHAIMRISGVKGVESHLHPGLVGGDTRPSEGGAVPQPPSDALRSLLDAARTAGAGAGEHPRAAIHAVLCGFTERMPEGERDRVLAHLPSDVRVLAGPARHEGHPVPRLKTLTQLVAAVIAEGGIDPAHAEPITRAVVAALRGIVHDQEADVAAVLPRELRELWETAPAAH